MLGKTSLLHFSLDLFKTKDNKVIKSNAVNATTHYVIQNGKLAQSFHGIKTKVKIVTHGHFRSSSLHNYFLKFFLLERNHTTQGSLAKYKLLNFTDFKNHSFCKPKVSNHLGSLILALLLGSS